MCRPTLSTLQPLTHRTWEISINYAYSPSAAVAGAGCDATSLQVCARGSGKSYWNSKGEKRRCHSWVLRDVTPDYSSFYQWKSTVCPHTELLRVFPGREHSTCDSAQPQRVSFTAGCRSWWHPPLRTISSVPCPVTPFHASFCTLSCSSCVTTAVSACPALVHLLAREQPDATFLEQFLAHRVLRSGARGQAQNQGTAGVYDAFCEGSGKPAAPERLSPSSCSILRGGLTPRQPCACRPHLSLLRGSVYLR